MSDGPVDALVELVGPEDTDAEEMDGLTRSLRDELLDAGVDDARPASAGAAPAGSKAGEALQVGALAVAVAPVALQGIVDVIRDWRARRAVRKITVTIGDDTLTLESSTPEQQEDLVRVFLDRHGADGADGG